MLVPLTLLAAAAASAAAFASAAVVGPARLLLNGHHYLSTAVSLALTKLSLRVVAQFGDAHDASKLMAVESLQIMCACLEYGKTCDQDKASPTPVMSEDHQVCFLCLFVCACVREGERKQWQ